MIVHTLGTVSYFGHPTWVPVCPYYGDKPKCLTCTASKFPKNCSTGRIWLLSSSGKMFLLVSSQSMSSDSCLSKMPFTLQLSKSSPILSSFSLPSCPSSSGDAEHLLLPADWWHSQLMRESLSRGPSALLWPLTTELLSAAECVFGLFIHLLLVAEAWDRKLKTRVRMILQLTIINILWSYTDVLHLPLVRRQDILNSEPNICVQYSSQPVTIVQFRDKNTKYNPLTSSLKKDII